MAIKKPYEIKFDWDAKRPVNPKSELVDITITDAEGMRLEGTVATLKFIEENMEKNKVTGEYAGGEYFCAPKIVIVRSIDEGCLRRTIEDLDARRELEEYFSS